jgi:hypothetical protein
MSAQGNTPESEPILSIVSVSPVVQPIRINETIHTLQPYESYGLVTKSEMGRDLNLYHALLARIQAGETLTNDEATLGDLAIERILKLALPSVTDEEWAGIAGVDRRQILDFFFEISNQTEDLRKAAKARQNPRSISAPSGQNSPDSTGPVPIRRSGGGRKRK